MLDLEVTGKIACSEKSIVLYDPSRRATQVADLGVDVLICGAISRSLKLLLESKGIEVLDEVCGDVPGVLRAYTEGRLDDKTFVMPGARTSPRSTSMRKPRRGQE